MRNLECLLTIWTLIFTSECPGSPDKKVSTLQLRVRMWGRLDGLLDPEQATSNNCMCKRVTSDCQVGSPSILSPLYTRTVFLPPVHLECNVVYSCHFHCYSLRVWVLSSLKHESSVLEILCFLPDESVSSRSSKPPEPSGEIGVPGLPPPTLFPLRFQAKLKDSCHLAQERFSRKNGHSKPHWQFSLGLSVFYITHDTEQD